MATVQHLELSMTGGTCDAMRAAPDGGGRHPGVLFVMDAVGLRPRIAEMVATVADFGYAVLAPNVYYRAGRQPLIPPQVLTEGHEDERRAAMMSLIRSFTSAEWALDGPAYLDHLASWDATAAGPARIVGYCMGGRLGLQLAAAEPDRVECVAAFHPAGLVTDAPDSAHRLLGAIRGRIYLGYADNDGGATPEHQAAFRAAAQEAGVSLTDEMYGGAAHGYTMADLPAYDADACARHWAALRRTFDTP